MEHKSKLDRLKDVIPIIPMIASAAEKTGECEDEKHIIENENHIILI